MLRCLFVIVTCLFLSTMPAFTRVLVQKPQISTRQTQIEFRFTLDQFVSFSSFRLNDPPRLVIDLPNARLAKKWQALPVKHALVEGVRVGTQQGTDLRIVLDLHAAVAASTSLEKVKNGYVLRVQVGGTEQSLQQPSSQNAEVVPQLVQTAKHVPKKQVLIVIDAGHGGKDPGAIGPNGHHEKKIVLAIAKKLKRFIDRDPKMRAVLTRSNDRFVPLRERVLFARRQQADMFISLHADAGSATASGASVYILSTTGASSEAARLLANKENRADLIGGSQLSKQDEAVASMLLDLSLNATIESSHHLGQFLLKNLHKSTRLHKQAVERAGFAVLKAPDIPSVLVETGFLSNPKEEALLITSKYQETLARHIFTGIKQYYKKYPATQLIVESAPIKPTQSQRVSRTNLIEADVTPIALKKNSSSVDLPPIELTATSLPGLPTLALQSIKTEIVSETTSKMTRYIVKKDETLEQIAKRFNLSRQQLIRLNNLSKNQLRVPAGTVLRVHSEG